MISFTLQSEVQKKAIICCYSEAKDTKVLLRIFPKSLHKTVSTLRNKKELSGKRYETTVWFQESLGVWIIAVGLGAAPTSVLSLKRALGIATRILQQKEETSADILLPKEVFSAFSLEQLGREVALAVELSAYAYTEQKTIDTTVTAIKNITVIFDGTAKEKMALRYGFKKGQVISRHTNAIRTLANTPSNQLTPKAMSAYARTLQKIPQITTKILGKKEIEKLQMGCLSAVASGSIHEPQFIIVEYRGGKKTEAPTVLVGKGITFDSGGISLKPGAALSDMKFDMLGGATVLGVIGAAAELGLKKNIISLVPACENMPSGSAYKPDDIVRAMNGHTVEIINTDAEGRLVLADALCYAKKYNPKQVIDVATLTGACLVAIGTERSGLFTDNEALHKGIMTASEQVGEQLWRLPLGEEFTEGNKSDIADIRNLGSVGGVERYGGASTGAAFLEHFTSYPWAHIDLSSGYSGGKGKPWVRGGANGFGVDMLVTFLEVDDV